MGEGEDKLDKTVIRLGLALSGGGIRAAVFHLGVLKRLAASGHLEKVTHISSVSGGSLVIGAVFSTAGMDWPSSDRYLNEVYPQLRELLTSRDLFSLKALGLWGAARHNWKVIMRRADVLAWLLEMRWRVTKRLADLPDSPIWYVNTTCFETGKNWRFSKNEMGDWVFGRHYSPGYKIAEIIAASAAVPYAIGALKFKLPKDGWWETDPATRNAKRPKEPPRRSVRLWDGGAYENLGLEALFKPAGGLRECDFLVCSDASGPLTPPARFPVLGLLSGKLASPRLFDIASDQIRALRSRMFMKATRDDGVPGILARIGVSERRLRLATATLPNASQVATAPIANYLSDQDCGKCHAYPTNLTKISVHEFDLLARHGFEVADGTLTAYASDLFGARVGW